MFAKLVQAVILSAACALGAGGAAAATVIFVPPNDTVGSEYSAGNDSWWMGRGITFGVDSRQAVTSVGLLHDLTGIDLTFGLYEISMSSVTLTRLSSLASGGSNVTTNGRDWIDYALAGIVLDPGKQYLLEFAFQGDANSNFYYDNQNVLWNQGPFTSLDGAMGIEIGNFTVAGLRIDSVDVAAAVPEPGSLALLALGMAALVRRRRAMR
ncbi:PEP-CTERM sorting domain-containing protein [Telluria beijingensis]|uniref:PEP-CTERM sorting domain-containing protein n=1 Tax=Telluria beijingensis TaxID=3068633 RepID=UPI0027958A3E|nr:PEP-CTERM sorting domain-containing protein [Massilia sp. REN29]